MANTVIVRTTAFIDNDWLFSHSDSLFTHHFEGNDRSFTYYTENQPDKYKMAQHIVVNFVTGNVSVYNGVGPTRLRSIRHSDGQIFYEDGQASDDEMSYTTSMNTAKTEATIYLRGASANPLIGLSPNIDWEYTVTVKDTGQVTVVGKHDGFPNHEIYKRVDGGTPQQMYTFNKQTLISLFPPMEHNVNVTL